MQIRLLEYFVALAAERHFARAAAACNVSQPTLSGGVAALEAQLGRRLVERDRRFIGLTPEGLSVLPWAQQLVAGFHALTLAATSARGPLCGTLRLGAIPAAAPSLGFLAEMLTRAHPGLDLDIRSMTSREIVRDLAGFELDAGVTYLDHEPPAHVISVPLYGERAMFVAAEGFQHAQSRAVSWTEVMTLPLCLLHQGMQNRRILDEQLARRGLVIRPRATADSYAALLAIARSGALATIMPDSYAALLPQWAKMLPFDEPAQLSQIGLVVPDRSPLSPLAEAALSVAQRLELPREFSRV